jgi:hypothetical protein
MNVNIRDRSAGANLEAGAHESATCAACRFEERYSLASERMLDRLSDFGHGNLPPD